jgi:hypothetical protein
VTSAGVCVSVVDWKLGGIVRMLNGARGITVPESKNKREINKYEKDGVIEF